MDDCAYFIYYQDKLRIERQTPEFFSRESALAVAEEWAENGTARNVRLVTVKPIGLQEQL